ncbi:peptidoglycan DD-metalloendopeptidase family protein [Candidatus Leptofilum sp.]|uniref:peptidoglycan DD-metalloendopeptidase family protein n=1 Tax=Candidatus Leptofilum sp. TaxID=3241576 RepID=UPI003B5ABECE
MPCKRPSLTRAGWLNDSEIVCLKSTPFTLVGTPEIWFLSWKISFRSRNRAKMTSLDTIIWMKRGLILSILAFVLLGLMTQRTTAQTVSSRLLVQPGDSWAALAVRFQVNAATLRQLNPHINPTRQPTIGTELILPETAVEQSGHFLRQQGGLLATAVAHNISPWLIAIRNNRPSPHHPAPYQPIFVSALNITPRELPIGFSTLELSQLVGIPGQAIGFRAEMVEQQTVTAVLDNNALDVFANGRYLVGLTGTGAFFGTQQPELTIQVGNAPPWRQPWQFRDPDAWEYQQLTLTGTAAQIDQQFIAEERERLFAIWEQNSGPAQWQNSFQLPINNYLEISSVFGVRRSYNGGPYRSYHEGVDFAAYGGTPVLAPASGTVVVAEFLYVRGGAVIIDHGLGIYSGYYHLSSLAVAPGDLVTPGQIIGEVGTTGLSTGNHLHWDLLVDAVWVDAEAWLEQDMACWILAGLKRPCE